jgi:hypothetical protein
MRILNAAFELSTVGRGRSCPVAANSRAIRAANRAILLTPVSCHIDHYRRAGIPRRLSCGTAVEAMHPSGGEMQGSANADDSEEHVRQGAGVSIPVVQMPTLIIVISQSRIGRSSGHVIVQNAGTLVGIRRIHDSEPVVNNAPNPPVVIDFLGELDRHPEFS